MSRQARIKNLEDIEIYSVSTVVNNHEPEFTNNPQAIRWLIDVIKMFKEKYKFRLYAYEIMGTHYHILIEPNKEFADISVIMREINGEFARIFNKRMGKRGHFWNERFSHKIVKGIAHMKESFLYFLKNPVRAGMVENPMEYPYSFAQAIIGQPGYKDPEGLLDFHLLEPEVIAYVMNFINQFVEVAGNGVKEIKKVSKELLQSMKKKYPSLDFLKYKGKHGNRYRFFSMSAKWISYYTEKWKRRDKD